MIDRASASGEPRTAAANHVAPILGPPDQHATWKQHLCAIGWILLTVAAMGYYNGGRGDLLNSLEGGYVLCVQEMVRDGDRKLGWVVPTLNERPRITKPPLPFWIGAAISEVAVGDHAPVELLRGISVVMGVLTAIFVYLLGWRMFDRRAGLWAALVWATCFVCSYEYRMARHDIYLAAFTGLTMLGVWMAWRKERFGWWITAAGLVLAFQTKGPVSWLVTVVPAMVFVLIHRPVRWRFIAGLVALMAIAALSLLPWALAMQRALDISLLDRWKWEAVGRFQSQRAPGEPPWYYVQFIGYLWPWSLYLAAALVIPFERKYAARREGLRFAWLWLIAGLVLMSLPREKQTRYVEPLAAPAALLIGQIIAFHIDLWRRGVLDPKGPLLWMAHAVLMVGSAAGAGVVAYALGWVAWPTAAVIGGVLLVAAVVGGELWRRRRIGPASAMSVGFAVLLLIGLQFAQDSSSDEREPLREKAGAMNQIVEDAPLYCWPVKPPDVLIYYANRTAPNIHEWYFMRRNGLAEAGVTNPTDTEGSPDQSPAQTLGRFLRGCSDAELYFITPDGELAEMGGVAEAAGYTMRIAMDLTTKQPRSQHMRERLKLVRLERVTATGAGSGGGATDEGGGG